MLPRATRKFTPLTPAKPANSFVRYSDSRIKSSSTGAIPLKGAKLIACSGLPRARERRGRYAERSMAGPAFWLFRRPLCTGTFTGKVRFFALNGCHWRDSALRLLVIEDDPDLNRQLVRVLTDAGSVVDGA